MIHDFEPELTVIGGGLAGSEAAWQAASRGINVKLYEMRPIVQTGAHQTSYLAELVCSNSLGSKLPDRASGILKDELRSLNSLLIKCADAAAIPAGGALAVDRELFSQTVTSEIENHSHIRVVHQEITEIPAGPTIIASGPLTSPKLSRAIQKLTGFQHIFFYDAIAPIIYSDSINLDIAFRASRYRVIEEGEHGDYLNCPMEEQQYYEFVNELINAEKIVQHDFEVELKSGVRAGVHQYFEGCLPVEIIAMRGKDSLAYGPLRPVGLSDPRTGKHSYAVVQLRQDNLAKTLYNIVGFQTNLKYSEQNRVFRMIPGLENADFARYGQMHRNTFIFSPKLLLPTLQYTERDNLFFAGQITGVEGYVGNIGTGWLAGVNAANLLSGKPLVKMPDSTMIGALCHYITHAEAQSFQPMKANLGILADLDPPVKNKKMRASRYAERSSEQINEYIRMTRKEDADCA